MYRSALRHIVVFAALTILANTSYAGMDGWVYFQWPYAYSIDRGGWVYFDGDIWFHDFAAAQWSTMSSPSVHGTVTYTGAGTVDSGHPVMVAFWPKSNTNMQGAPSGATLLTSNPGIYSIDLATGQYHAIVMHDSNGDGVWDGDGTTPYEIYNDIFTFNGSSLQIVVQPGRDYNISITFDDSHKK